MLSRTLFRSLKSVQAVQRPAIRFAGGIATDLEQQVGRRKLEVDAEHHGMVCADSFLA